MDNIFLNVVKNENSMTELLRNFLSYELFRNEFLKLFLEPDRITDINSEDIVPQKRIKDCGQPDLRINNDKYEILVEIKIRDAILTENQPTSYLKHLAKQKKEKENVLLVFLIPKHYAHQDLWKELVRLTHYDLPDDHIVPNKIIFWEDILKIIRNHDFLNFNQCFVEFSKLISDWFEVDEVTFSNAEVDIMYNQKSIPTFIVKLFGIVDEVKKYSSKHTSSRHNGNVGEYSVYFRNEKGEEIFYFGVWFDFWEKHQKPLCFGVSEDCDKIIKNRFMESYPDAITKEGWIMSWIEKDILNDENGCLEKINQLLEKELLMLSPTVDE